MALTPELSEKVRQAEAILGQSAPVLIAYSGGVDSSVLLALAQQTQIVFLGLIADSPSLPRASLHEALQQAARLEAPVEVLQTRELDDPRYSSNPPNRCYFCKAELFQRMEEAARQRGFASLAYGENADDPPHDRPGSLAAKEFSVLAPLRSAGLRKSEIRQIAHEFNLASADRPAMPCLSSRIPHGQLVTPQSLNRVEQAEAFLLAAGYQIVRVRHLLTPSGPAARVLVSPAEVPRLLAEAPDLRAPLLNCGFVEIEFDPAGYQGRIA
jgi:uncharacterized protein